jgi:hypothetical protein
MAATRHKNGCAFHVTGLESLAEEFHASGLGKERPKLSVERHDDADGEFST